MGRPSGIREGRAPRRIPILLLGGVFGICLLAAGWFAFHQTVGDRALPGVEVPEGGIAPPDSGGGAVSRDGTEQVKETDLEAGVSEPDAAEVQRLGVLLAEFRMLLDSGASPSEILDFMETVRQALLDADPSAAAAALLELLHSGVDADTGLPFIVGPEGVLDSSPTLRTTLLDWLGQTDPREAAAYSREILATTLSADEYALALRNLVWAIPPPLSDPEVARYLQTLLDRTEWRSNPSAGYLEAFDFAVGLGATGIRQMAGVLQQASAGDSRADRVLEHASFIALDRLLLRDPNLFVQTLEESPGLLADVPDHRASLYSRLDVRDSTQNTFLKKYLVTSDPGSPEMLYFFSIFPNPNRFDNHRLASQAGAEGSTEAMALIDRATVQQAKNWLGDTTLAPQRDNLRFLILRLSEFL